MCSLPPALLDAALLQWSYKKLSSNWYNEEFVRRPSYLSDEERVEPCNCKEGDDCEDNCVNRAMLIECSKKCSKGDKCKNQVSARSHTHLHHTPSSLRPSHLSTPPASPPLRSACPAGSTRARRSSRR